jgi:ABC transporter substrate binding protein (PQQ-dependent alcohol dehydrogenase system)
MGDLVTGLPFRRGRTGRLLAAALMTVAAGWLAPGPAAAQDQLDVRVAYVTQDEDRVIPLSLLDTLLPDEGLMGARQAITENQTTGRFLGHDYQLAEVIVPEDGDVVAAFKEALAAGQRLFILDLHGDQILSLADLPEAAGAVLFNTRAPDDRLRLDDCRANLFHVMPSRAMKADALAQYLVWKQWRDWFLIRGTLEPDLAFAAAIERSAKKFGAKIVETREYEYVATARRTDSGHVQIQTQIPVFTQDAPEHDVVMVADESDIFGEYLPYRTWDPRPVVGTQGLIASAWHRSQEQWGATQVQRRFEKFAGRWMFERDYTAWLTVRIIGEAVTRTGSAEPNTIHDYLRGDQFEIAAFKGEGLTFRKWNQQLRQPILVVGPRMLVSVSPQPGFLHQRTPLDTMGYDEPESSCELS